MDLKQVNTMTDKNDKQTQDEPANDPQERQRTRNPRTSGHQKGGPVPTATTDAQGQQGQTIEDSQRGPGLRE